MEFTPVQPYLPLNRCTKGGRCLTGPEVSAMQSRGNENYPKVFRLLSAYYSKSNNYNFQQTFTPRRRGFVIVPIKNIANELNCCNLKLGQVTDLRQREWQRTFNEFAVLGFGWCGASHPCTSYMVKDI